MPITTEPDLTIPAHQRLPEDFVWEKLNALELCDAEQVWLLEHLEESTARALKGWDKSVPHNPGKDHAVVSVNQWCVDNHGVNPKGMERLLGRIREVEEGNPERFGYYRRLPQIAPLIDEQPGEEFFGLDAIRVCITDAMEYMKRYDALHKASPAMARHPTMYTKDARGRLTFQGVGSDSGMVRAFTCWILHEEAARVDPTWANAAANDNIPMTENVEEAKVEGARADYRLIEGPNFYECPVKGCNKRFDFNVDDESEKRKSWNKMRLHMVHVKKQVDDHREAKTVIFG